MSVITTGSFAKALYPGVNKWYGMSYNDWQTEYDKMFETFTSRRAWEEDVSMSGLGLAYQLGEGASIQYNGMQQGFVTRYTMAEFALGMIITKNMVKDDLYDVVAPKKAGALARSMRQTKETVAANVYNRAFNTTYRGGDGSTLIASAGGGGDTSHSNIAGGTWTNGPSVAADISEASLEQAVIDIGKMTDDAGLKIAVRAQKLIVPVDLDFEVNKIMQTEYEVGTANNTRNIVRSRFPGGVFVSHYLTDVDAWFIKTDTKEGLKHFERDPMSFETENDFDTSNAKFKAQERYAFGWSDAHALYGSPGA